MMQYFPSIHPQCPSETQKFKKMGIQYNSSKMYCTKGSVLQISMQPDKLKETVTQIGLHGRVDLVTPPSRQCTKFVITSRPEKHISFLQIKEAP